VILLRILVIGELNVDLILKGYRDFPTPGKEVLIEDYFLTLGSASAICAMGLARLGDHVSFLGKVGCDEWGEFCIQALAGRGIDVYRVARVPELKTGVTVSVSSASDRALITYLGSIVALRGEDIGEDLFDGFGHLHISSYYLQENLRPACRELFARAHKRGLTTSLDPGFDPSEKWAPDILETLKEVDVFFPNEVELRALSRTEDPADGLRALENGVTQTVAKLGPAGAMALRGDTPLRVPAPVITPVDTTGAGDSFNAGFLHAWLVRKPLEMCLRYGIACGSMSTLGLGGTASQPGLAQVEEFLSK
jgi:sugar/nucleoside kinase (ribokinase family)